MQFPKILAPSAVTDPAESPRVVRRRRLVVAGTAVAGATLLGGTLAAPRGSGTFYLFALLLAATWLTGSVVSGPLHLGNDGGEIGARRAVVAPIVLGGVAFLVFLGADVAVRQLPVLSTALRSALATADAGPRGPVLAVAILNGVAEEVFFRGALHSALGGKRPGLWATTAYVLVTVATLNAALVAAAVVMGTLFSLERRATRGVLAPALTHTVWTVLMVLALPR